MSLNYKLIFESTSTEIVLLDVKYPWVILNITDSNLRRMNKTKEEVLGRDIYELFPDYTNTASLFSSYLQEVVDTKKRVKPEILRYDIKTDKGVEERYWSLDLVPVIEEEKVSCILRISLDLTELVKRGLTIPKHN